MKEKFNYVLYHLDLASTFIGILGLFGIVIGEADRSFPMCVYSVIYLGARFTWAIMVKFIFQKKKGVTYEDF